MYKNGLKRFKLDHVAGSFLSLGSSEAPLGILKASTGSIGHSAN
jgi:hypothetical protein